MGILLSFFHSGCDEISFFKHCAILRFSIPLSPTLPLAARTCTTLFCTCTDQPLANGSWETPTKVSVNPVAQLPIFLVSFSTCQYLLKSVGLPWSAGITLLVSYTESYTKTEHWPEEYKALIFVFSFLDYQRSGTTTYCLTL